MPQPRTGSHRLGPYEQQAMQSTRLDFNTRSRNSQALRLSKRGDPNLAPES